MPLFRSFHPGARLALRRELGNRGYTRHQIQDMVDAATDENINLAVQEVEAAGPISLPTGAFGDGSIIQAILDFFKSPQGQAIIAALIKLLLGFLGG